MIIRRCSEVNAMTFGSGAGVIVKSGSDGPSVGDIGGVSC